MICCVTGGNGFIGRRLTAALHDRGDCTVRLLSRQPRPAADGVAVVPGDLANPDARFDEFLDGADVVFHCAGETRDIARMRPVHVDGTRRLLEAAARTRGRSHPLKWVQLSSVGAYGPPRFASEERVVTEQTPTRPVGEYEVTKTRADELVMGQANDGAISYVIVRPSNVFGPDMTNNSLRALGTAVRRGIFFYVGAGDAVAPYVHVDDVAGALIRCGFDSAADGQKFNISNDCSLKELINAIADAVGARRPRVHVPEWLVRSAVTVAGRVLPLPISPSRIDALVARTHYPHAKIEQMLGFVPRHAVAASIGAVVGG